LVTAPIRVHGQLLGTLTVTRDTADRPYTDDDRRLVEDLADRAGLAFQSAASFRDAREAVSVRDEFLSIAGHELRTPLTALQLQLQNVERRARSSPLPPWFGEKLQKATAATRRLSHLVNQLLDVSRIVSGRLSLDEPDGVVDLAELSREAAARAADEAAHSGCRLIVDAPEPVRGRWDALRIEQVLANLIANATKYGRGQPVEIGVYATEGMARIEVRDHGIGIAAEDQARIFEEFQQARGQTPGKVEGTGLGLSLARRFIEMHGGRIWVESEVGKGSTFTFALPVEAK
jgi:signal transduction histidine kinase